MLADTDHGSTGSDLLDFEEPEPRISNDQLDPAEDDWYHTIREEIVRLAPDLRQISLQIFENPEVGGQEIVACRLLTEFLERHGFQIEYQAANMDTAFVATYESAGFNEHSRIIGFFTEYDALPDIGHACGHNLIAVGTVASAIATKVAMDQFGIDGQINVFGSPDEENLGGKIELIEGGYLKYPDVCLIAHPGNQDLAFMRTLALQGVSVHYHGKSAHAAISPWEGLNALDAVVQSYTAIAMYRQQLPPGTQIHGIISDGGGRANNVIPKHASANYVLRSETARTLTHTLKGRVTDILEGVVRSTGCQLTQSWDPMYMEMNLNGALAGLYQSYMERLYQTSFMPRDEQMRLARASTDMGNVSFVKPSIHPMYRIGVGTTCNLHTDEFRTACQSAIAHEQTWKAGVVLSMIALKVLTDDPFYEQVVQEFRGSRPLR
ncbi:hypothetical protein BJ085DRAFT_36906 [Dimargaris cristalligena]|uniref:Peptidase M20 domain-containing protein 2 n=1 Tax=Dimargaris cristalligena TaxID=215637 RepID=A0A4Q0A1R2_9FUNG|nr:hypothetical protein BJ085DRAFT_36906 [Dimargaris cristalligena]|eukprot:RKP39728.1 hypothetical protein BJ085DRAFT_36906 [Dimargaris cristalligena]